MSPVDFKESAPGHGQTGRQPTVEESGEGLPEKEEFEQRFEGACLTSDFPEAYLEPKIRGQVVVLGGDPRRYRQRNEKVRQGKERKQ